MRTAEDGTGLVELLVAAVLALLGLAVVAAVARGPIAAATAAARPQDRVEGVASVHDVVAARVRRARGSGPTSPVLAAGPDHLVLGAGDPAGGGWWRVSLVPGSLRVDEGAAPPPSGPSDGGREVLRITDGTLLVRDVAGAELAGAVAGPRGPGDVRLLDAAVVELHLMVEGRPSSLAVALRPGG